MRLRAIGRGFLFLLGISSVLTTHGGALTSDTAQGSVRIVLDESAAEAVAELGLEVPLRGRVFLIVARAEDGNPEPRLGTGVTGNPLWGMDIRDFKAGDSVELVPGGKGVRGYPLESLDALPPGDYLAQAFINVYTTFERADGKVVHAHLNSGAFQDPFKAPGNAYSEVVPFSIGSAGFPRLNLSIDRVIEPARPLREGEVLQQGNFEDTEWVKYVKIRSELLSEFWGRDMYIGANILLPHGYEDNPEAVYPVLYMQGHSSGLTPVPWSPQEWFKPGYEANHPGVANQLDGFHAGWTSGDLSKLVVITFRDANPYFDTSYSVNTENVGPYQDAIIEELIPYLEQRFRLVNEPWGRVLAGRSTGGWEAAAMMIFNPDFFAGSFPWAPDPVDFRKLMQINIYEFENAFYNKLAWINTPLPAQRETDGLINYFVKDEQAYEETVADRDRSGGQWGIWRALFSPVDEDGYPQPLWDAETGVIDPEMAEYWRENWDLSYIVQRDWDTLGPKLQGKLHFAVGRLDNYYLQESVYLIEDRLSELSNPPAEATFQYGTYGRHSWIGHSPENPDRQMTYAEFIDIVADYIRKNAPESADLDSWGY